MDRDADRAGLIGDGAADGLANPPGGVGGKFVPLFVLELVHRLHQTDVALLDQIQKGQAAVGVAFGDGDHQTQVGLGHAGFGLFADLFTPLDLLQNLLKLFRIEVEAVFARLFGLKELLDLQVGAHGGRFGNGGGDLLFGHVGDVLEDFAVVLFELVVKQRQAILQAFELLFEAFVAFERRLHRFDQFVDQLAGRAQVEQAVFEHLLLVSQHQIVVEFLLFAGIFGRLFLLGLEPIFFRLFQRFEGLFDLGDAFVVFGALFFRFVDLFVVVTVALFEAFEKLFDSALAVDQRLFVIENEVDQIGDGADGVEDDVFAHLDLFGDFDLLLFGQKRNLPHLPQVHPHGRIAAAPLQQLLFPGEIKLVFEIFVVESFAVVLAFFRLFDVEQHRPLAGGDDLDVVLFGQFENRFGLGKGRLFFKQLDDLFEGDIFFVFMLFEKFFKCLVQLFCGHEGGLLASEVDGLYPTHFKNRLITRYLSRDSVRNIIDWNRKGLSLRDVWQTGTVLA